MKTKTMLGLLLLALLGLPLAATPAAAHQAPAPTLIYLRRGGFDPLEAAPAVARALRAAPASSLKLVQFAGAPGPAERQSLVIAGLHPLAYIPDNTLLVRQLGDDAALASIPGLRWAGQLQLADKLVPDLEPLALTPDASRADLRVLLAPDADLDVFARTLAALGGMKLAQAAGMNGIVLRVQLPATALIQLLGDDAVLWVERAFVPRLANDRAQVITGVAAARQQLSWLNGSGQIIAVTDTGLDVQAQVQSGANPDFAANRIVAAATPAQMNPSSSQCLAIADWSDRLGHGTHVAGTVLGAGLRSPSGVSFAGAAPAAGLVVQAVSSSGRELNCLLDDTTFLSQAYAAGARVHNASWGSPTGGTDTNPQYGGYDLFAGQVDQFLWSHKDYLLVAASGNEGSDMLPRDGVIDPDSINSPASAKNVLAVGASENNRPGVGGCASAAPENLCWSSAYAVPIWGDQISDDSNGLAAFSSRGPTDDGRLKPEIVAPGTNIVSAASHHPNASYPNGRYNADYAYSSGTSMSAPLISGIAALVRQWLAHEHGQNNPSAALVKALLLNGATNISPGQYGPGVAREIPAAWPNNAQGWGRAALADAIAADGASRVWFADNTAGLNATGASASYDLFVALGQPLRLTLSWTDYPASPNTSRALVNDLDLEVRAPDGTIWRGNAQSQLAPSCRDAVSTADRCNPTESVEIASPAAGLYRVTVRGAKLPFPPQPFALVARARQLADTLVAPVLALNAQASPVLRLSWNPVPGATFYRVEASPDASFTTIGSVAQTAATDLALVADRGEHWYRVRACVAELCGAAGAARSATVSVAPHTFLMPLTRS